MFWTKRAVLVICLFIITGCSRHFTVIRAQQKTGNPTVQNTNTSTTERSFEETMREGLILFRQGNMEASQLQFEKAIEQSPYNWRGYYYLGLVLTKKEQYAPASSRLFNSLDYAPEDKRERSLIYVAIAENYEAQGEFGKAELNYHTALNLNPNSQQARNGMLRLKRRAQQ